MTQGAMLSVLDSDKRLADHFGGKVSLPSANQLIANPTDAFGLPRAATTPYQIRRREDGRSIQSCSSTTGTTAVPCAGGSYRSTKP